MPRSNFVRGNTPRVYIELLDADKQPVDPTTLIFKYQAEGVQETVLTYGVDAAIVRESTGKFYALLYLDTDAISNKYFCRWEGTGVLGVNIAAEIVIDTSSQYREQ
jgi:hypothetical protein